MAEKEDGDFKLEFNPGTPIDDGSSLVELENYQDIPDVIKNRLDDVAKNIPTDEEEEEVIKTDPIKDDKVDKNETEKVSEEIEDLGEYEPQVVDYFLDQFQKEVGWEFDNEEKPKSIKDIVKYMEAIVQQNTQNAFASDEIAAMNEYVKDGGRIDDYVNKVFTQDVDLDAIDTSKISTQRMLVSEDLRNRGYDEVKINRMLRKFEDTDSLEEEAEDALSSLKTFKEDSKKTLLQEQAKVAKEQREAELSFLKSVDDTIKGLNDVNGISISDKEKVELRDYLLKRDHNGTTEFQKDYSKNVKNLIVSAYHTKYGDRLVNKLQKQAATQATKSLKTALATRSTSTSKKGDIGEPSIFSLLSAQLSKPKY